MGLGTAADLNGAHRAAVARDRRIGVIAESRSSCGPGGSVVSSTRRHGTCSGPSGRAAIRAGRRADYLLLQEHPHVYTLGRNADSSNLLISDNRLAQVGALRYDIDRGGDITYHGPGQLVGYPIVALADTKRIVPYVRALEEVLIRTLADFGVAARREDRLHRGVDRPGQGGGHRGPGGPPSHDARLRPERGSRHGLLLLHEPVRDHRPPRHEPGRACCVASVSIEEAIEVLVPRFQEVFGYSRNEVQIGPFTRRQGRPREL